MKTGVFLYATLCCAITVFTSYKGTISYEDFNSDITYLYLSADNELEVQLSYWYKDGGIWAISFQPTDENDLKIVQSK